MRFASIIAALACAAASSAAAQPPWVECACDSYTVALVRTAPSVEDAVVIEAGTETYSAILDEAVDLELQEPVASVTATADGVTWTVTCDRDVTAADLAGVVGGASPTIEHIWAEENSTLANNTLEWAFGNGSNAPQDHGLTIQVPPGFDCELRGMTLTLRQGSATVRTYLSNVNVGQVVSTGNRTSVTWPEPVPVVDGQSVSFRTHLASGTAGPNIVSTVKVCTPTP